MRWSAYYTAAWCAGVSILALSVFLVWKQRQEGSDIARVSVVNTAEVLATQVESSLDLADALLQSVGRRYRGDARRGSADSAQLAEEVRMEVQSYQPVSRVGMVNSNGQTVFNTALRTPFAQRIDASNLDYFQRARAGEKSLIYTEPLRSDATGEWTLTLARRVESKQGVFLGVVYATIPVRAIGKVFAHVGVGAQGSINMRTAALAQVVRCPELPGANSDIGNRNVSQTIQDLMRSKPGQTLYVYKAVAPIDSVERMYAYQKFDHSPFWMNVGRATADFDTAWRQTAVLLAALTLAMSAFLVWGARRLTRQHRDLEHRLREQSLAKRALHDSEQRFRRLFHDSPVALCVVTEAGVLTDRNRRFNLLFGYSPQELRTIDDWWRLAYPNADYRTEVLQSWNSAVASSVRDNTDIASIEYQVTCRNGGERTILISGLILGDGILATFVDITDRKMLEDGLVKLNAELEARVANRTAELQRSNRELEDFAYIASHDLKEPLRGLHNYASFLQEDYADKLDDAGKNYLERMQRLVERLTALIDGLLAYSRLGSVDLLRDAVAVDSVVDGVCQDLHVFLREHGVVLVRATPLPTIQCNALRVREVFQNLITNAAKYNDKPDKRVEIGCREGPVPVFYVRDNGIGIPAQHHEAIFRIFKRLHEQRKYGGGTGVGLTIVKKIIERHGGHIWLESVPNEGSTFYFTLSENP